MNREWREIFQKRIEELGKSDSWQIERDDSIIANAPEHGWMEYIRNINGRFKCSKCKNMWPSKRVKVVFNMRLRTQEERGTVKVRFYKQKCRRCADPDFEEPRFRTDNIDLLLEKLMEKIRIKCYKEDCGEKGKFFHFDGKVDGPHETSHCEACLQGVCTKS
ncbi:receptor-transporting protein 3-like [Paramormyrops kingsleyae]|uniref:receptor-transporting protein 3-like n=1 Tax=Paramormyrops kingsleyae TaxID=1676925 RepID=UPI003B96FE09